MKLDPFVVEVIRHGLSAAAEEMSLVMTRSARSPLLREAGDLSSAITDGHGGLVGQGQGGGQGAGPGVWTGVLTGGAGGRKGVALRSIQREYSASY